jgi:hypothetical protein
MSGIEPMYKPRIVRNCGEWLLMYGWRPSIDRSGRLCGLYEHGVSAPTIRDLSAKVAAARAPWWRRLLRLARP